MQQKPQSPGARLVANLNTITSGVRILASWVGKNAVPVRPELADKRARICAGCHFNKPLKWSDYVKAGIAKALLSAARLKNKCGYRTASDRKLRECKICLCFLRLKVWCPIKFIEEELSSKDLAAFPAHCWIRKETDSHEASQTIH